METGRPHSPSRSEYGCYCRSSLDLAVVPMGGDGLDERFFSTLECVQDHGGDLWWLHLSRCSECGQNWMIAQEERIYDDHFLLRLSAAQAEQIVATGRWPDEFISYERVLTIGRALSQPCIYLDGLSSALADTVQDLRRERTDITDDEIAHLIGVAPRMVSILFRKKRRFWRWRRT